MSLLVLWEGASQWGAELLGTAPWQLPGRGRGTTRRRRERRFGCSPRGSNEGIKTAGLQHVCLFVSERSAEARVWLVHWLVLGITSLVKGGVQAAPEFTLPTAGGFADSWVTWWKYVSSASRWLQTLISWQQNGSLRTVSLPLWLLPFTPIVEPFKLQCLHDF